VSTLLLHFIHLLTASFPALSLASKKLIFLLPFSRQKVDIKDIELKDLRVISTLGIGGFGRVELVTLWSDNSQSFALKVMKKSQV